MDDIIKDILDRLKAGDAVDDRVLEKIVRAANRGRSRDEKPFTKKRLLPYYLKLRETRAELLAEWGIDDELNRRIIRTLQVKPGRTASGVATIAVITKPWPCSGACVYCPSDLRMPKSYLADEPACQRAERNRFDPYLQVVSRLRALEGMGHPTGKVELIVLGGTWSDYPQSYRIWFAKELFRALNDGPDNPDGLRRRRTFYRECGISNQEDVLAAFVSDEQALVDAGKSTYNEAVRHLYIEGDAWKRAAGFQQASWEELEQEQRINEHARRRAVGLVVETRPDAVSPEALLELRRLGCTKVQVGVQSIRQDVLDANKRGIDVRRMGDALDLIRLFGFKIHTHLMVNLMGMSEEDDIEDYARFANEAPFQPDEIKLYPCSLVGGTPLENAYRDGRWTPYGQDALVDVLVRDILATPPYIRVSRMIRDIPATDILAGNKTTNLRQMVESRLSDLRSPVHEIRFREVGLGEVDLEGLRIERVPYETRATRERFLQWVDGHGRIAGFLRLSLPDHTLVTVLGDALPVGPDEAMIREVHVYGSAQQLHESEGGAQHLGLGRRLIAEALRISRDEGYKRLNVISSVGTREYYRSLGFEDKGLYQQIDLSTEIDDVPFEASGQ